MNIMKMMTANDEEDAVPKADLPKDMYVKLVSSDEHEFYVKRDLALTSQTIKAMLSGPGSYSLSFATIFHAGSLSLCRSIRWKRNERHPFSMHELAGTTRIKSSPAHIADALFRFSHVSAATLRINHDIPVQQSKFQTLSSPLMKRSNYSWPRTFSIVNWLHFDLLYSYYRLLFPCASHSSFSTLEYTRWIRNETSTRSDCVLMLNISYQSFHTTLILHATQQTKFIVVTFMHYRNEIETCAGARRSKWFRRRGYVWSIEDES